MPQTFTKKILSGSTDGKPITITGSNTAGSNTLHTASVVDGLITEVYITVYNTHTEDVDITLEWGETTKPMVVTIPALAGEYNITERQVIGAGFAIKAFASMPDFLRVKGFVHEIV